MKQNPFEVDGMSVKHIIIDVPKSYNLPDIYQSSEPRLVAQVLDLGANILINLRNSSVSITNDEIFQNLKSQAEKEYLTKIKELVDQLTKAHQQNEDLLKNHEKELCVFKQESAQRLEKTQQLGQSKFDILQIQYNELLKTVDTIKNQIRQEEREQRKEILAEKDKAIESLKEQLQLLRQNYHLLTDNFQDFKKDLLKTTATQINNSSIKGKIGEKDLQKLLNQVFGNTSNGEIFSCEESSKEAYSADIQLIWRGGKILWESKNYSEAVNSKEIKKFQRDFEINKEFAVGVIVSLYSGIVGHTKYGNIDLETLPDGRSILYISNLFSPESPEPIYTLASLRPFLEIFIQLWKRKTEDHSLPDTDNKEIVDLKEKNEIHEIREKQIILMLNKHLKAINETKNQYNVWENKLKEMIVQMKTSIREHENYTKQMLDILLLTDFQNNSANPSSSNDSQSRYLNTTVFKFRNFEQDYDSSERKIIDELLTIVEVSEDSKISGKELKDALRNKFQWTDKKFNDLKGKILQPEIWEAKSKDVKHFKFRDFVFLKDTIEQNEYKK